MTGRDIEKLCKAGFKVFRLREDDKSIWEVSKPAHSLFHTGWKLVQRFETKTAAKKAFEVMMTNEKFIQA